MQSVRITLLALLLLPVLPLSINAQTDPSTYATVILLRRTGYSGSLSSYPIFMDGKRLCEVSNRKYSEHRVFPGKHIFSVNFGGKMEKNGAEKVELDMEAGRTYYLKLDQRIGFTAEIRLEELTSASGSAFMKDLKEELDCK
jgi:hypothetical protein